MNNTQLVSLWFENDYGLYSTARQFAGHAAAFESWAMDYLLHGLEGLQLGVFQDLLYRVDWHTVLENVTAE